MSRPSSRPGSSSSSGKRSAAAPSAAPAPAACPDRSEPAAPPPATGAAEPAPAAPLSILLITPPLTQLNTPYPATAYLARHLRLSGHVVAQHDLGIELTLEILRPERLRELSDKVGPKARRRPCVQSFLAQREAYLRAVSPAVSFLQGRAPELAQRLADGDLLPRGQRFADYDELAAERFGVMALADRAKFAATLFLEDVADFIRDGVDSAFSFTRYREKISLSASSFDELEDALEAPPSPVDAIMLDLFEGLLARHRPQLVCFSVPFPGNLYSALRLARHLREVHPGITITLGGGFPNTELRSLRDPRLFHYTDFVTLDDGEGPLTTLCRYLQGRAAPRDFIRTFALDEAGEVAWLNAPEQPRVSHRDSGWPDYDGLDLSLYLDAVDLANPMSRLWSDGRWLKLTLAHGCYWKRCSFCDITLDYIQRYDEAPASLLADRLEELVRSTGRRGFHFVDEAAPPRLLAELAVEILRRGLVVSWWTNIRYERAFTPDLARLLAASGCIAVSGGLEVASDRLLLKMKKGTSVSQVSQAAAALTGAGILTHAYLMYGFPSQTAAETVDALEVVRQLFAAGLVHSAFWHRFALTEHSPCGKDPKAYGITVTGPEFHGFARNELTFIDQAGVDHDLFGRPLATALRHYMLGQDLQRPALDWFADAGLQGLPPPSHAPDLIESLIAQTPPLTLPSDHVLWIGGPLQFTRRNGRCRLQIHRRGAIQQLDGIAEVLAEWLEQTLCQLPPQGTDTVTWAEFTAFFEAYFGAGSFAAFTASALWDALREAGLLLIKAAPLTHRHKEA